MMKFFRKNNLVVLLGLLVSLACFSPISLANDTYFGEEKETEVGVILEKDTIDSKEKDTIYTPTPAVPVRRLPDTGEIITSFVYIIIGLSLILFIFSLAVVKLLKNDMRWEY
ncbi:hypothetical protein DOK76_05295 [Vagococcus sp. DIV0080]|uniref:Gram-positive cocci surface proteins LPxTG domain-containing protein n=1 Tax=Candidatus Vagococcus giribetii TaxID=2230876 RepID=A0ABS3HRT1_9ENTE|nr:hypothetical protein [Vagococcus sp. DIV0080]MBO0476476.1 hypothetical protein [Vagococcus sp. DIV0080]